MPTEKCPLGCKTDVQITKLSGRDVDEILCRICGRFRIVARDVRVSDLTGPLIPYLRAHTRQESEAGRMVEISQDWRQLADGHAHTSISRKLDKALERLASRSDYPGAQVSTEIATDFPLFDARFPEEATYLLVHLIERGFLKPVIDHRVCIITPAGWARLDPPTTGGVPGTCFVAMSFDTSLENAYTRGIHPAIEVDCGYKAIRIDLVHHNEKICDRILAEIRRSQFMVVDFTMQRHNVYFEAGFALGLGRPVIWSCREDEIKADKLQFDTRQYNHIAWTTANDLRQKLANRIRATILPVK